MKNAFKRLLCLAAGLSLTACAAGSNIKVSEETLLHHNFVLQSVDGKSYNLQENAPTIAFNEGMRVSGAICNQFMGKGSLNGNTLTVAQMVSTKKLCFEQELNQYEYLISQMLMAGVEVQYDGKNLTLRQGGHELVYLLKDFVN